MHYSYFYRHGQTIVENFDVTFSLSLFLTFFFTCIRHYQRAGEKIDFH